MKHKNIFVSAFPERGLNLKIFLSIKSHKSVGNIDRTLLHEN